MSDGYFVVAVSFAAPFFSDTSKGFVQEEANRMVPEDALRHYAANYTHPCGLYAAALYADANAYHRGEQPLARWLSNHEQAKRTATEGKKGYSYFGHGPGDFEIDGERINIQHPKEGGLVPCDKA